MGVYYNTVCPICEATVQENRHWCHCPQFEAIVCMKHCYNGCMYHKDSHCYYSSRNEAGKPGWIAH